MANDIDALIQLGKTEASDGEATGFSRPPAVPGEARPSPSLAYVPHPTLQRYFIAPFVAVVKFSAFCIAAMIWLAFGPVWFALLFRTTCAFALATVRSLFKNSTVPDPARLEYVASFWMRGFGLLFSSIRRDTHHGIPRPSEEYLDLISEIVFSVFFFTYVVVSLTYIQYWLPIVTWTFATLWWLFVLVISLVFSSIANVYHAIAR